MQFIKQLAIAGALAIIGVGANAATETEAFFIDPSSNLLGNVPNTNEQLYDFSNSTAATTGDARVAKDTFIDTFSFNVQDNEDVSFYGASLNSPNRKTLGQQEVSFTSISLYAFNDSTDTYMLANSDVTSEFFDGAVSLTSGLYTLQVNGMINIDGGQYSGQLDYNPTPAVPEPGNIALMLAGLSALGVAMRRRNRA